MVGTIGTTSHVALDRTLNLLRPIKWIHTLACLFAATEDFTVADRDELQIAYPEHEDLIERLSY